MNFLHLLLIFFNLDMLIVFYNAQALAATTPEPLHSATPGPLDLPMPAPLPVCREGYAMAHLDSITTATPDLNGEVIVKRGMMHMRISISNTNLLHGGEACLKNKKGEMVGLSYHIHEKWNNDNMSRGVGADECGYEKVGGHWDPTLACGPLSGNPLCSHRAGCVPPSSSGEFSGDQGYLCTPAHYYLDPYLCEVGDLSSKHGDLRMVKLRAFDNDVGTMYGQEHYQDSALENTCLLQNRSIVFHCQDSTRIFCAKFELSR